MQEVIIAKGISCNVPENIVIVFKYDLEHKVPQLTFNAKWVINITATVSELMICLVLYLHECFIVVANFLDMYVIFTLVVRLCG